MRGLLVCALLSSSLLACGGGGGNADDQPDAKPFDPNTYSVKWGPVTVPYNTESTQCIWVRLSNENEIKVHSMHNVLTDGSHHLIVYKDDMDTTEQTTPTPCQPFTGALNSSGQVAPIAITQRKDDPIELPAGVAYTFAPHQMIKLEMHYTNKGDTDIDVSANVDFVDADPGSIQYEASILLTGSPDVNIPGGVGQTATLHEFFTFPAEATFQDVKFFAITGHTHRRGTSVNVKVGMEQDPSGLVEVYAPDPFEWAEPATETPPEFSIPSGGGFDFTCSWTNDSAQPISWGESAEDEMCFFWGYYYPAVDVNVCMHTDQQGGYDLCCPGNALCGYIESML
jgi:hypothetical protein